MAGEKNYYIDKREMYTALVKHRTACEDADRDGRQRPRVSEYLGKCFLLISRGLATKRNFAGYLFIEDMVMDAVENCVNVVLSFNPDKYDNPHAYFTLICWRAFLRRIEKEKKALYSKHKVTEDFIIHNPDLIEHDSTPEDKARRSLDNAYMQDLAKKFEEKDAESRAKRSAKKAEKRRSRGDNVVEFEIEVETRRRGKKS
jgi:hypothetical protein